MNFLKLLRILPFVFLGLVKAASTKEHELDLSCLDALPDLLAEVDYGPRPMHFCTDFADGVTFSLDNFFLLGSRRGTFYQGGGPAMLVFRHKNYLASQDNRLQVILSQRTKELWDVHFRDTQDPEKIYTQDRQKSVVIWGTNQRVEGIGALPLAVDDNSMRVLVCTFDPKAPGGCRTIYNVPICDGYQYPKVRARNDENPMAAKPNIRVFSRGHDETQAMLNDFGRINLLARNAIHRIMQISCQGG